MGVNATTTASFDVWSEHGESADGAARVAALIPVVSRQIEKFIGHEIELTERTEDYSVEQFTRTILLRQFPVTAVSSVQFDPDSEFDPEDNTADFQVNVDKPTGLLHLLDPLESFGPNSLRVVYTAGLAATAADVVANYPDVAYAANIQVAHMLERRKNPAARRDVGAAGGASFIGELQLLKSVRQLLQPYRRMTLT